MAALILALSRTLLTAGTAAPRRGSAWIFEVGAAIARQTTLRMIVNWPVNPRMVRIYASSKTMGASNAFYMPRQGFSGS
jgi:hypothetical protein